MLELIPFSEKDEDLYSRLVFNEQTMTMNLGRVFTAEEAAMFFQMVTEYNASHAETGFYKVLLCRAGQDEFIGMGAITWNEDENACEIEYMLLPEYWHQGYGTALAEQLLRRVEEIHQGTDVVAITDPANVYSQRILQRFGFALVKEYMNDDGEPAILYRKTN